MFPKGEADLVHHLMAKALREVCAFVCVSLLCIDNAYGLRTNHTESHQRDTACHVPVPVCRAVLSPCLRLD